MPFAARHSRAPDEVGVSSDARSTRKQSRAVTCPALPVVVACERHAAARVDARSRSEAAVGYAFVPSQARGRVLQARWARDRQTVCSGRCVGRSRVGARKIRELVEG